MTVIISEIMLEAAPQDVRVQVDVDEKRLGDLALEKISDAKVQKGHSEKEQEEQCNTEEKEKLVVVAEKMMPRNR